VDTDGNLRTTGVGEKLGGGYFDYLPSEPDPYMEKLTAMGEPVITTAGIVLASITLVQPLADYHSCMALDSAYSRIGSTGSPEFYFAASSTTTLWAAGVNTSVVTLGASMKGGAYNPFSYGEDDPMFKTVDTNAAITFKGGSFAASDAVRLQYHYWYEPA